MYSIEAQANLKRTGSAVVNTDMQAYTRAKERKKERQFIAQLEERLVQLEKTVEGLLNANKS